MMSLSYMPSGNDSMHFVLFLPIVSQLVILNYTPDNTTMNYAKRKR